VAPPPLVVPPVKKEERIEQVAPPAVVAKPQPPPPKAAVSVVTSPDWLRRPTASDMERYYPERALSMEKNGEVRMTCKVKADGTLEDCKISSETPSGFNFGSSALKMAGLFKMKPETRDGEPVAGASVTVPIVFKLQ
jgi:protein TonB